MSEILIIGAGPTGLTLACELAVRGTAFRLVDAAEGPFEGSRAKGLQPRTLEVFDRLGIVQELVAAGHAEMPYRQHTADGFVDVPRKGLGERPDVPWPSPIIIPQWRTEAALRARLEALGGHVEYGVSLVEAEAGAATVRATLRTNAGLETASASWLVGCDGGRSRVRHAAGLRFLGETHEEMRMLVGDMRVEGVDRAHWHIWRPPTGGFMALCPLAGTDAFQVQIAIGPKFPDATTLDNFQALATRYTGRPDIQMSAPTWMSLWHANVRMVDRYRAGRLLVAGDAAHVHTPAGGQGMNTGIQDAFNLGWKLAAVQRGADIALLDTYESERLPVATRVLGLSSRLAAEVVRTDAKGMVPRDEEAFQLGIQYGDSPLSRELRAAPGRVRAGDRAPDATGLRDGTGQSSRLFDLLRGPEATIIAFGRAWRAALERRSKVAPPGVQWIGIVGPNDDPTGGSDVRIVADTLGHAAAAWEAGDGALFAIRPDGVVGLAIDRVDERAIDDWLARAGQVLSPAAPGSW